MPARGQMSLAIYGIHGELVRTLQSGVADPGQYVVRWDGRGELGQTAPAGMYFARLKAGGQVKVSRLVVIH